MKPAAVFQKLEEVLHSIKNIEGSIQRLCLGVSGQTQDKRDPKPIAERAPHNTTRWKIFVDVVTLILAAVAASAYFLQLITMQRNMKIDQRPWIVVQVQQPVLTEGEQLISQAKLLNTGKTPAFNIISNTAVEIIPIEQIATPQLRIGQPEIKYTLGILYPNSERPFPVIASTSPKDFPVLTHEDLIALKGGHAYVMVHGQVAYSDAFNTQHWAKYCSSWEYGNGVSTPTKPCVLYNAADKN